MNHAPLIIALVAAPVLVSCGSQSSENVSANVEAIENVTLDNLMNQIENDSAEAPAAEPGTPEELKQAEPAPRPQPDRAPPPPRPKAKAPPPPVDPHAGHDMGNMANMQH